MRRLQTVAASIDPKNIDSAQPEEEHVFVVSVSPRRPQQTQLNNGGLHDATGSVPPHSVSADVWALT
jgi:hypothetical protein